MFKIVKYPSPILRQKAVKVKNIPDPLIQRFIKELSETMIKEDGIGLAANQVASGLKVLAVKYQDGVKVFINPFIYYKSWASETAEEGCLSFPGVFGLIKRSKNACLFYRDEQGRLRHLKAKGLLARVLQHELDHLNGVLFIDKMVKYTHGEDKVKEWLKQEKQQ